ncbi:arginyl-tRNA synthetase [Apiospora saccharicola]|uniref:arginine--tRNA ligase n=1 Tax=Apiospora saccharicola TaxID=335842 RepID=A0ABR1UR21_9PEZI
MASLTDLEGRLAGLGLDSPFPAVPAANALTKPIDIYRLHLASLIATTLECDVAAAYEAISTATDLTLADLAVVVPKLKPKDVKDIKEFAVELVQKLPTSPLYAVPYPDGVQLRFFFSQKTLPLLMLPYIRERGTTYGEDHAQGLQDPANPDGGRKNIVVEFSSPNIPGDFNGTHLRSTIIGGFVAKMYECMGWDVVRMNYLGDFGKNLALFAVGWDKYGSEEALEANPLEHIMDVFVKIEADFKPEMDASKQAKNENKSTAEIESQGIFAERDGFFKRLEDKDEEALAFWKKFRDITLAKLEPAYARLGVTFDEYSGESQPLQETMIEIEATLTAKGVLQESDGSQIINFEDHGHRGLGTVIVRARTGSSTYFLRDLAAAVDREKSHAFDKMIYVVASKQNAHFHQVFRTLELLGREDLAKKMQHVSFGDVTGMAPHVKKTMSLGQILDDVAEIVQTAEAEGGKENEDGGDEAAADAGDCEDKPASTGGGDPAAVGGLLSLDLFGKRSHGYAFDKKRMAAEEGDSCRLLQREHAKLFSVIADLKGADGGEADGEDPTPDHAVLQKDESIDLLRMMAQYPDVTASTFKALEPHGLLSYLSRLAEASSYELDAEGDDGGDENGAGPSSAAPEEETAESRKAKLMLYECVKQVLGHGMNLLGVPPIC